MEFLFRGNGHIEFYSTVVPRNLALMAEKGKITFFKFQKGEYIFSKVVIFNDVIIEKEFPYIYVSKKKELGFPEEDVKVIRDQKNDTIWVNPRYRPEDESLLCGQKFLGEYFVVSDPEDLAYPTVLRKSCDVCFYKPKPKNKHCNIVTGKGNKRPRTLFRRRRYEEMPSIIDKKNVAQYCKFFSAPCMDWYKVGFYSTFCLQKVYLFIDGLVPIW